MAVLGGSWRVPPRVVLVGAAGALALLLPLAGSYLWLGVSAALPLGMGYVYGVRPSFALPVHQSLLLAVPAALSAAVAVAVRGQPFPAACLIALCCLAIAPANRLREGLLGSAPTVVAVLVSVPVDLQPLPSAAWLGAGSVVIALVGSRLPRRVTREAVEASVANRHAVVMAAACGVVTYLVVALAVPHGYWVPMTLTVVLRPFPDQTRRLADQRVLGATLGAVLALAIGLYLPTWLTLVALAVCMVLAVGYALAQDQVRYALFLTPMIVLIGSGAQVGTFAAERVLATTIGALLAAGLAVLLNRWNRAAASLRRVDAHRPGVDRCVVAHDLTHVHLAGPADLGGRIGRLLAPVGDPAG